MSLCELCDLVVKTKLWYSDDYMTVIDCLSCKQPLIVWREHKADLSIGEELHVLKVLVKLFHHPSIYHLTVHLDRVMKSNMEHWHIHYNKVVGK